MPPTSSLGEGRSLITLKTAMNGVEDVRVINTGASDHLPMLVTLNYSGDFGE
ncbi:MAG: hypothetical protein ACOC1E_01740 [Marinilabiliaceae bacterium]